MALLSLSQRDPKWSNIPLGTSKTTTIGSHGCTITSLAMLLGTTPDVVNKKLLSVNGYAQTNLIIWTKIPEAFPGTSFVTRAYTYNNNQVKATIEKNGGCLVEVDAARIGAPTHWVLYIGNGQMIDPWTGVQKATSYYPPKGYAVINVPSTQGSMSEELQACLKQHTQLVTELEAEKRKTSSLIEETKQKDAEIERLRGEKAEQASIAKTTKEEMAQFMEALATKLTSIVDKSAIIGSVDRLISEESEYIKKVKELENAYDQLVDRKHDEIEALKRSIEELKAVNEKQAKHISTLETRLTNLEHGEVKQKTLLDLIQDLFTSFRRK